MNCFSKLMLGVNFCSLLTAGAANTSVEPTREEALSMKVEGDPAYLDARIRSDNGRHFSTKVAMALITPPYKENGKDYVAYIMIAPDDPDSPAEAWVERSAIANTPNDPDDYELIIHLESGHAYVSTDEDLTERVKAKLDPQLIKWSRPRIQTPRSITAGQGTRYCVHVQSDFDRIYLREGSVETKTLSKSKKHNNMDEYLQVNSSGTITTVTLTGNTGLERFINSVEVEANDLDLPGLAAIGATKKKPS